MSRSESEQGSTSSLCSFSNPGELRASRQHVSSTHLRFLTGRCSSSRCLSCLTSLTVLRETRHNLPRFLLFFPPPFPTRWTRAHAKSSIFIPFSCITPCLESSRQYLEKKITPFAKLPSESEPVLITDVILKRTKLPFCH